MTLPSQTRCNLFNLAVLSWQVGGGGSQFKVLLNHVYTNNNADNNNDNDSMVTQISPFR